ncbi:hypothetical protein [Mycetocola reblochoni]|uniref:Antitoxin HicB n=2 Tax=Mycetocola reblochoni TaxID=331618 RepID=A0A1R4KCZ4_9MICO|nr:hypothetical protein [Mycetocola reblochoni]RLP71253.1 antitoxin HicB [Mycetocola reblochoni]SJN42147.1 hypothetical protein FM119_13095 [Mycetocola reblochoni REB411]
MRHLPCRWEHGWELDIDADNATQVRTFDKAPQQVRDYLDTLHPDADHSSIEVHVVPELGALSERIREAQEAKRDAEARQLAAARQSRDVAAELHAQNLSGTDIAAILGVSRGRVSQLINS